MMLSQQLLFLIIYAMMFLFAFPYLHDWVILTTLGLIVLSEFFLFEVSCKDPGYLKNEKIDLGNMLR